MKQRFLRFGPDNRLCGILTEGDDVRSGAPIMIVPSTGLNPRAGPFGLNVEISQRLALHGMRTFRYDSPGAGEAPRVAITPADAAICVLDMLERETGTHRFIMGGICSASDLAWRTAADPRVCGLLMIDSIAFKGFWYKWQRVMSLLRKPPAHWIAAVQRRFVRSASTAGAAVRAPTMNDYRDWPDPADAKSQFAAYAARGVEMLWIYTGSYADVFLDRRQFREAFGRASMGPRVRMHYWKDLDHVVYARSHRDRLLDEIEAWALRAADAHA